MRAEDEVEVGWSGDVPHPGDFVPLGTPEGEVMDHVRVGQTWNCERQQRRACVGPLRLEQGRRTLARATIEVVDRMAAIDTGGTLDAPETAAPGEEIEVSWTSSSASGHQRSALAEINHRDFTWIGAQPATNEPPLFFATPEEPGLHEIRLLDLAGQKFLIRRALRCREATGPARRSNG